VGIATVIGSSDQPFGEEIPKERKVVMSITLERSSVLSEVQRLLPKTPFTKEDSSRCERLMQLADTLSPGAMELRKLRLAEVVAEQAVNDPSQATRYRQIDGVRQLSQLEQDFNLALRSGKDAVDPERRALAVGTGGQGGYLVPQAFSDGLWATLKAYDPLFNADVVNLVETGTGSSFPIPINDDASGVAAVVAENALNTEADPGTFAVGNVQSALTWRAPMVRVSREMVQDSHFPLAEFLATAFAIRFARGIGASLITNLIGGSTQGVACGTGHTTDIPYDSMVDLVGSIDPAYLASPKAAFLMRFATLVALFKLKASTAGSVMLDIDYDPTSGRFMLWGKPIYLCPSVPALAASAKTILFGDLSRFVVHSVRDSVAVKPFFERYAEYGQVGYSASMRVNASLISVPGADSPVKYLQQSAT
jgi:HK97 family phage major capsid protein